MRHRLFIMPTKGWQFIPNAVESLAKTGNIAMAKNTPNPSKRWFYDAIQLFNTLRRHPAGQRLRHG